jgi:hypothetical protein
MKHILFLAVTAAVAGFACTSAKNSQSQAISQGLTGRITEVTGNQMPMKDASPKTPPGVLTTVYIYEPTNLSQVTQVKNSPAEYTEIRTKQVASVTTDSTGHFSVALPSGSYSVFVGHKNRFYANLFDSQNNIAQFTVEANKLTTANLTISSSARF